MNDSKSDNSFKVLAVIPARGGSKGVPRKNLRTLGDKPLIAHIAHTAHQVHAIDKVIISTEDQELMAIAKKAGIEVPFIRPPELASDTAQLAQVIYHSYKFYLDKGVKYDAIISLQPTAPFLSKESMEKAIQIMINSGCDSVCTIAQFTQGHPYIAKSIAKDGSLSSFCPTCSANSEKVKRRQDRKEAFYITGGFYLRGGRLMEGGCPKGHWLGQQSKAVVLPEIEAVDIDSELDFQIAEFLYLQQ